MELGKAIRQAIVDGHMSDESLGAIIRHAIVDGHISDASLGAIVDQTSDEMILHILSGMSATPRPSTNNSEAVRSIFNALSEDRRKKLFSEIQRSDRESLHCDLDACCLGHEDAFTQDVFEDEDTIVTYSKGGSGKKGRCYSIDGLSKWVQKNRQDPYTRERLERRSLRQIFRPVKRVETGDRYEWSYEGDEIDKKVVSLYESNVKGKIRRALEIDDSNATAWLYLARHGGGIVHGRRFTEKDCIINHLDEWISIDSLNDRAEAWHLLGMLGGGKVLNKRVVWDHGDRRRRGQTRKKYNKKECFLEALYINDKFPLYWFHLGEAGGGEFRGTKYSAQDCYKNAIMYLQTLTEGYVLLSQAYEILSKFEEAGFDSVSMGQKVFTNKEELLELMANTENTADDVLIQATPRSASDRNSASEDPSGAS